MLLTLSLINCFSMMLKNQIPNNSNFRFSQVVLMSSFFNSEQTPFHISILMDYAYPI